MDGERAIHLRPVNREEAARFFEWHPHLANMWRRYYVNPIVKFILHHKADGHIGRWSRRKTQNISELFVIEKEARSIGFTGFFKDPTCPEDTLRLRWTGLIASEQGNGLSAVVIDQLCVLIKNKYPNIKWLSESYPVGLKALAKWFAKNKFMPWEDPDKDGIGISFVRTQSVRRAV